MNTYFKLTYNKKINDTIFKYINAIISDVSYNQGGLLFFFSRLIWNSMILYYMLNFLKAFFLFAFRTQGLISDKRLELIGTLLWAVGIMYMVNMIGGRKVGNIMLKPTRKR